MYAAKCLTVLIVLVGLAILWILQRKKANQVMVAVAATILVGGVLRLLNIKDDDQTVHTVGFILVGLATVWVVSWLSNRASTKRRVSGAGGSPSSRSTRGKPDIRA